MIGPLESDKAGDVGGAAEGFDVVHQLVAFFSFQDADFLDRDEFGFGGPEGFLDEAAGALAEGADKPNIIFSNLFCLVWRERLGFCKSIFCYFYE